MSKAAHQTPRALRRRVMRAVRAEPKPGTPRRRRIGSLTLSAAPTALAFGLVVAAAILVQMTSAGPGERVIVASAGHAAVRLNGEHGELIINRLSPAPLGTIYELWIQRGQHRPSPSTLFAVTARDTADLGVPGDLSGVTRLMVTAEPVGGSAEPTRPPVIVARLAD